MSQEQKHKANRTNEHPNGFIGKTNNQVPITIITGTRINEVIK